MSDADLLQRIAQIFRQEIGPAVDGEYQRTQAFMASVVLQKVSRQVALAAEHATAESADLSALLADLGALLGDDAPPVLRHAVDRLARARDSAGLCGVIDALYAARTTLGETRFASLLGRVRRTLRRSIDRRMAIAG